MTFGGAGRPTSRWPAPNGQTAHWQVSVNTPAGPVRLRLAHRRPPQRAQCAGGGRLRAGRGVPLGRDRRRAWKPSSRSRAARGRSRCSCGGRTITLVDDTYNANPDSVRAAIDVLAELPGPRLLVLGDMGEVGDQGPQFHAEVGEHARERGIEQLFDARRDQCGMPPGMAAGRHFDDIEPLNAAVLAQLPQVASVLVKGSRFMKMERVVQAIVAERTARQGPAVAAPMLLSLRPMAADASRPSSASCACSSTSPSAP